MDPITAGLAIFELVPSLLRIFGKERPADVVNKVGDLARVITGTPDLEKAKATLETDPEKMKVFIDQVSQRATDWARLHIEDMQDARKRDIEIQKTKGTNRRADNLIAVAFFGVFLCGLAFVFVENMSPDAKTFLATVGGMLIMKIGTAFDFEFGSSSESHNGHNLVSQVSNLFKK